MDEEMEVEPVFEVREVDIDYEFEAAMYFDLSRAETQAEASEAELWFDSAKEYPPSQYEGMDRGIFTKLQSGNLQKFLNQPFVLTTGMAFYSHTSTGTLKAKAKSAVKPFFPRSSTLMKPTASQLAKQNRPVQVSGSRFQMQLVQNNERSLHSSSGAESQAVKRQKLEGGHLRKDETVDKSSVHGRMKITIPREPELETANRAQRIRPKNSTEREDVKPAARRFKARPLNRKILEAPSLSLPKKSTPKLPEFQGLDKPSTFIVAGNGNPSGRPNTMDATKQDGCDVMHNFKARPLNKKIFSSKGDIGVFRNNKREATVPMEFNFHTEKRIQHNPPTDLFSKLSLTSELQQSNGSRLKLPHPTSMSIKGSKENRLSSFQPEHEILHPMKGKPPIFGGKQIQRGSDGCISEGGAWASAESKRGQGTKNDFPQRDLSFCC
uniref:TPX2 central domain-containing protein n=1 Tax=Fagus sylvatica TaxID=28930 RepID=A0A2N9EW76_FAGSY